jgi:hypothetical protein
LREVSSLAPCFQKLAKPLVTFGVDRLGQSGSPLAQDSRSKSLWPILPKWEKMPVPKALGRVDWRRLVVTSFATLVGPTAESVPWQF